MCSVTWGRQPGRTVVHCSRDERRDRPVSLPPAAFSIAGVQAIAPIDPVAGGTWIWANEHGLVATLLNFYEATPPPSPAPARSRGLLLRELAASPSLPALSHQLHQAVQQHRFAPFWIVAWQPGQDPARWRWDGIALQSHSTAFAELPFSSSSWNTAPVLAERKRLFHQQFPTAPADPDSLRDFHLSISANGPEWGPLMSRTGSQTVSLTHVTVTDTRITMACRLRATTPASHAFEPPIQVSLPRVSPSAPS